MIKILNKNIIGAIINFAGNKSKNESETIERITYPDTIWTIESGYALHYSNNTRDKIYSIVKNGKTLSDDEIMTFATKFIFGKFECNWADEFDVEGCNVMLQEEFDEWYNESSKNLDKCCNPLSEEDFLERVRYKNEYLQNLSPYDFKKKNPTLDVDYDKILPYDAKNCKNHKEYLKLFNDRHSDLGKYQVGFGTNQTLEFTSKEEFWKCFTFTPCSEEVYTFFKNQGEIGKFPINVEY